jgi:hypothetical protein
MITGSTDSITDRRRVYAPLLRRVDPDNTAKMRDSTTRGLCGTCKRLVDVTIDIRESDGASHDGAASGPKPRAPSERDGSVWFIKNCPDHGPEEHLVSSSAAWYEDALSFQAAHTPPRGDKKPVEKGCPFDCGPCTEHEQRVYMPVIPITSACNLDCPICYTVNKNDGAHMLSKESFAAILAHLVKRDDDLDIINFTGGEPTLHPELPELLRMSREAGYRRLTISTNGLKLASEEYVRAMAAADARIVLSLDTFDDEIDKKMLGATTVKTKLKVLDLLEQHDVTTTILPAVAKGMNDRDVGPLLNLVLSRPNICSLEMHTLTFTGQGGVSFPRNARITTPDLHRLVDEATGGRIVWRDFVPSPLAHPHCYSICYLLMLDGGGYVPWTRFLSRQRLFELLGDSIYIEPRDKVQEAMRDAIDDLWADPDRPGLLPGQADAVLATLKRLITSMFPPGNPLPLEARRKIAERATKAIYIHSHMDEETFDTARIKRCNIGVPEADGTNIPTCAYNVLYREEDRRFADPTMLARMSATRPGATRLPLYPG